MTTPSTNRADGRRRRTGPASPGGGLVPAARYPVMGQPATTVSGLRAAADLIERSAVTGLHVACDDRRIQIQVTGDCGDAPARAAIVACLARYFGGVAVQEDSRHAGYSCITANGSAGGLPAEIFTPLTVQQADAGPGGEVLLAAAPGGRTVLVAPPHDLPVGHRWLTDLDPSPAPASIGGAPGHAASSAGCPAKVGNAAPCRRRQARA